MRHDPAKANLGNIPAKDNLEEQKKGENKGIDFSDYDYVQGTEDAGGRQYGDWWLRALMFMMGLIF